MKSKDSSSLLQGQPKGWRTTGRCNAVWEHLEGGGFVCDLITHPPLITLMDIVSCRSHDVASKTSPRTSVLLPHIPGRSKMNIYKEIRTKNDARILPPRIYFYFIFFTALGVRRKRKSNLWIKKNPFGCSSQEPTDHLGCSRPPWHNHSHLSKIWAPAPARYSGSAPFRLHFFMLAIEPRRTFYHKRPSTEKVLTLNLVCTGFNFFCWWQLHKDLCY